MCICSIIHWEGWVGGKSQWQIMYSSQDRNAPHFMFLFFLKKSFPPIFLLNPQINFRCKPSFRESGSRNVREVRALWTVYWSVAQGNCVHAPFDAGGCEIFGLIRFWGDKLPIARFKVVYPPELEVLTCVWAVKDTLWPIPPEHFFWKSAHWGTTMRCHPLSVIDTLK